MKNLRQELHDARNEIVGLQIHTSLQSERIAELERQICVLTEFIEHAQYRADRDATRARELLSGQEPRMEPIHFVYIIP